MKYILFGSVFIFLMGFNVSYNRYVLDSSPKVVEFQSKSSLFCTRHVIDFSQKVVEFQSKSSLFCTRHN